MTGVNVPPVLNGTASAKSFGTCPASSSAIFVSSPSDSRLQEAAELFFGDERGPDRLEPTTDDFVTDVTKPVRINLLDSGNDNDGDELNRWPLCSVPTLMRRQVEAYGDRLALHGYDEDNRWVIRVPILVLNKNSVDPKMKLMTTAF
jgi:hypothetical protein